MFDISKIDNFLIINTNNSYISDRIMQERLYSILYAKGYDLSLIKSYKNGDYKNEILAKNEDIELMEKDLNFLIENLKISKVIFKKGNDIFKYENNKRNKVEIEYLKENSEIYIYNNIFFSLKEVKEYKKIIDKSEIKKGMIVEILNNNKWVEKKVENIDYEYENIYKLFIKHEKIRFCLK